MTLDARHETVTSHPEPVIPPKSHTGELSDDVARAVRELLPLPSHELADPRELATSAADVAGKLTRHLARLVGEIGVRALFKRSVLLSSVAFPWLAPPAGAVEPWQVRAPHAPLCEAMTAQPAAAALEGFVAVLSTFVTLLGRLIGEPLMRRLLLEIWPAQFGSEKETE